MPYKASKLDVSWFKSVAVKAKIQRPRTRPSSGPLRPRPRPGHSRPRPVIEDYITAMEAYNRRGQRNKTCYTVYITTNILTSNVYKFKTTKME